MHVVIQQVQEKCQNGSLTHTNFWNIYMGDSGWIQAVCINMEIPKNITRQRANYNIWVEWYHLQKSYEFVSLFVKRLNMY